MKPFKERTGPEKVVKAMMFPYMQVVRSRLHVVGLGGPSAARKKVPNKTPAARAGVSIGIF
jgi:hypothetical protein